MDQTVTQAPALRRFRHAVAQFYGDRVRRVVLFGSRARGDARPDSDYDVAVFLRDMGDLWDELRPLGVITTDILVDTGAVISAKPFRDSDYTDSRPLMREIRRDGLELCVGNALPSLRAQRSNPVFRAARRAFEQVTVWCK